MLKKIPKNLSPEIVKTLMEMGHGDEIVLADANFPAHSCHSKVIRADGLGVPALLESIMQLFPLDRYSDSQIGLMQVVPGDNVKPVIWDKYKEILENKILVDCTNPLKSDLSGLTISGESSGGEYIQNLLPKTKVIKAFNTVGYNIMESPVIGEHKAVMYFSGNDPDARHAVKELILDVGFDPIEAGDIKTSRLLEPFALLWISTAYKFGLGRNFAFGLIKEK